MPISFNDLAIQDIEEALEYLREENEIISAKFLADITKALKLIESRPLIGRPTQKANIREWSIAK